LIKPGKEIEVGDVFRHRGQKYVCVAVEPYIRKDGTFSGVATIMSHCADCDAEFTFKVGVNMTKFGVNRRCPEHVAPLRRVRRRKFD
jgi:hypothetical protein